MERTWGYIRVSSKDQCEDRQRIALREFGVLDANMILDKRSGKDFERPGYRRLLRKLKPDDTLVIKSIDRLGRNYQEILEQWRMLTNERQAAIVVLDMPLLDTRQGRDLTGMLIADIVLQLLSYVAETERAYIRQRQAEGIVAAKAKGVHFGRTAISPPENFQMVKESYLNGRIASADAAGTLGVSISTFFRWVRGERGGCLQGSASHSNE